jgi:hypothetical protein
MADAHLLLWSRDGLRGPRFVRANGSSASRSRARGYVQRREQTRRRRRSQEGCRQSRPGRHRALASLIASGAKLTNQVLLINVLDEDAELQGLSARPEADDPCRRRRRPADLHRAVAGNTADVTARLPVVDRLRERFSIGRVCWSPTAARSRPRPSRAR